MNKKLALTTAIAMAVVLGVGITSTGMQVKADENCNDNGGGLSCQGGGGHVTFGTDGSLTQEGNNGGNDGAAGRTVCDNTGCVSNGQGVNSGNGIDGGNSLHSHK